MVKWLKKFWGVLVFAAIITGAMLLGGGKWLQQALLRRDTKDAKDRAEKQALKAAQSAIDNGKAALDSVDAADTQAQEALDASRDDSPADAFNRRLRG